MEDTLWSLVVHPSSCVGVNAGNSDRVWWQLVVSTGVVSRVSSVVVEDNSGWSVRIERTFSTFRSVKFLVVESWDRLFKDGVNVRRIIFIPGTCGEVLPC